MALGKECQECVRKDAKIDMKEQEVFWWGIVQSMLLER